MQTEGFALSRRRIIERLQRRVLRVAGLDGQTDIDHRHQVEIGQPVEEQPPLMIVCAAENNVGGSQRIAAYLDPQPGDRILDGCSGAGGKALHAAALAGNQAEIRCMDVEAYKLGEAEKRALRAGVSGLRTELIRSPRDVQRHAGWANKMLLDVPCSGTGVIRRDVDTKWKLQPEHLERTRETATPIARALGLRVRRNQGLIEADFGAAAYFKCGHPFPEETKAICDAADAILKGPIGLSHEESKKIPVDMQPERGALLPLRRRYNTFANF